MPKAKPYREWSDEEKARHRESVLEWRRENPEQWRRSQDAANARRRRLYNTDPEYREKILSSKVWQAASREGARRRRAENKKAVFDHYGRECRCCGDKHECFLSIDHKNNDGASHRRQLDPTGKGKYAGSGRLYQWLVKNNFPENFQTLCQNCNSGKYRCGGICPHEQEREAARMQDFIQPWPPLT